MLVIGIDPGTRRTGYGIVRRRASGFEVIDYGCIRPPAHGPATAETYLALFEGIEYLVSKYPIEALAVETQYVHKNVQSAIKLGMARGVAVLAASRKRIPVFEYTPSKAKLAVVGNGRASKEQVALMTQRLLGLKELPEPEDAADALALAVCHLQSITMRERGYV